MTSTTLDTFTIGGDLTVNRLGYGTMQLTGPGVWGEPRDPDEAVRVLRRALELGVNFIDTADSYGPHVAEQILYEALHPYPDDVVIATKAGLTRNGPDVVDTDSGPKRLGPAAWPPVGRPEYLRQQVLMSMRRLGVDQIDLLQLHRVDPKVPLADQIGELKALQDEGKIREIGMSQCTVAQLDEARQIANIVSVQSRFNVIDRSANATPAIPSPAKQVCSNERQSARSNIPAGISRIPPPTTSSSLATEATHGPSPPFP